jgi:hypothetical protein
VDDARERLIARLIMTLRIEPPIGPQFPAHHLSPMETPSATNGAHDVHRAALIHGKAVIETATRAKGDLQSGDTRAILPTSTLLLGYRPAIAGPSLS